MSNRKKDIKGSAPDVRVCGNCQSPEGSDGALKLSACARCGLVAYCSKDCQRAHWKISHKPHCVAKIDRSPQQLQYDASKYRNSATLKAAAAEEECIICLDSLNKAPITKLKCTHVFHAECVEELRKFGVKQACPLCRSPLPAGPEQLNEEATRRYLVIDRQVAQGKASWSSLSPALQREIGEVIAGWRSAADQDFALAQYNLGLMFMHGRGVKQSDVEAARLWKKSAAQGFSVAQLKFGFMCQEGRGTAMSDAEAAFWYKKAADQGNAEAQRGLGSLYELGRDLPQSDVEAARWY